MLVNETQPITVTTLLEGFNHAQLQAVLFPPDNALQILAGPGSGKTTVLTHRIAYMILHYSIPPSSICAVAFTNKAVDQMREHLTRLIGPELTQQLKIGTFHSLCARFLCAFGTEFSICDADESSTILTPIVNKHKKYLIKKRISTHVKDIQSIISRAKATGTTPDQIEPIYEEYQLELQRLKSFDFDDLLLNGLKLFTHVEEAVSWCQYVLVDELLNLDLTGQQSQGTSTAQYLLMYALARHKHVTSYEDFDGIQQIRLDHNYRSTMSILNVSSAILAQGIQSQLSHNSALHSSHPAGPKPFLCSFPTWHTEAEFIATEVKRLLAHMGGALSWGDIAILSNKFLKKNAVKDILAYLQLVDNPEHDLAFVRACNVPRRGIGDKWRTAISLPVILKTEKKKDYSKIRTGHITNMSPFILAAHQDNPTLFTCQEPAFSPEDRQVICGVIGRPLPTEEEVEAHVAEFVAASAAKHAVNQNVTELLESSFGIRWNGTVVGTQRYFRVHANLSLLTMASEMSVQEAQFVIMRKRKRQAAVDPCLGFYRNISPLAASPSSAVIANVDNDATDHPGWTPLPQDPPLTNQLDHTKATPEPSDLSSEPEPLTVEAFLRKNALGRGRIHVQKYGRKYRNRRIIQSDDECGEDERPQSCKPSRQPNDEPKPRAIRLWATRAKGVPFRISSFSDPTKKKKELITHGSLGAQCHPLNTWSTFRRPERNEANRKPCKVPPGRKQSTRCAPLVFVPLADAEKAYNNNLTKRKPLPHLGQGCPATTPLTFVVPEHTKNVNPNQSCSPAASAKFPAPDGVLEPALEISEPLPLAVIPLTTQVSPSCSKKTSSDKPLKPLGSFLEGFIERVRAATQAEDTIISRPQHQASTPSFVEHQESLRVPTSESISDHGLEQPLSKARDRTPGFSCFDEARRPPPFTCSNARREHLHATAMKVDQFDRTSLDVRDDILSTSQEEFPPYVPPATPFDINAALLAYTQAGNSCIQL
ncbi:hypothetical protein C0995_000111 [Termitomyces sp. Mi166|nr:hypothetical protein C0995_000111 [Termitomyces sp. Mi166\